MFCSWRCQRSLACAGLLGAARSLAKCPHEVSGTLVVLPTRLKALRTSSSTTYVEEGCVSASHIRDNTAVMHLPPTEISRGGALAAAIPGCGFVFSPIVPLRLKFVVYTFQIIRKLTKMFVTDLRLVPRHWCALMPFTRPQYSTKAEVKEMMITNRR